MDRGGEIHWYGLGEYPPTEDGERAAVDEWEHLHARHLLTASQDEGGPAEITAILGWLDTLTVESPVAMLSELDRVQRHTAELVRIAVRHARQVGMGWQQIADALRIDAAEARRRYDVDGCNGRSDDRPRWA